jgi:uncharacterized protein YqeY
MSIEDALRQRLTAAIRARDLATANAIRMINTKVMERRTAKGFVGKVDDALHVEVIAAYSKSLRKAIEAFLPAGDKGKAHIAELQFEIDLCAEFLPKPLGGDEIRDAVRAVIAETGASDPKMAGRVVGAVMKQLKGRVDAAAVKAIADEELAPKA